MCGRYTLINLGELTLAFPWIELQPEVAPVARYNIAPTQPVLAATNSPRPRFDHLMWGLVPSWAKDPSIGNRMINARCETVAEKAAFRTALRRRRCIIPADGFYEWRREPDGKTKTPVHIHLTDGGVFGLAGLWEEWGDANGNELRTCTIITTSPNELMRPIHDRMPVILTGDAARAWLAPGERPTEELLPLLKPFDASRMEAVEVSRAVNNPKFDDASCVRPAAPSTLFG